MKIILNYPQRLGDIVRIFPLAAHLAKAGHEVFIECLPQYSSILGLVNYAKWKDPGLPISEKGTKRTIPKELQADLDRLELRRKDPTVEAIWIERETDRLRKAVEASPFEEKALYDLKYNLSIWPNRFYQYRHEKPLKKWLDFILSLYPGEFKKLNRDIVFTDLPPLEPILKKYGMPADYSLACPTGFSQSIPIDFFIFEHWLVTSVRPRGTVYYLMPPGMTPNRRYVTVGNLSELATLIRHAIDFATINSGPAPIACAKFEGKPLRQSWHHVRQIQPQEAFQDDMVSPNQRRWMISTRISGNPIVPETADARQ